MPGLQIHSSEPSLSKNGSRALMCQVRVVQITRNESSRTQAECRCQSVFKSGALLYAGPSPSGSTAVQVILALLRSAPFMRPINPGYRFAQPGANLLPALPG